MLIARLRLRGVTIKVAAQTSHLAHRPMCFPERLLDDLHLVAEADDGENLDSGLQSDIGTTTRAIAIEIAPVTGKLDGEHWSGAKFPALNARLTVETASLGLEMTTCTDLPLMVLDFPNRQLAEIHRLETSELFPILLVGVAKTTEDNDDVNVTLTDPVQTKL